MWGGLLVFFSFFLLFNGMGSKRSRYGCMSRELHIPDVRTAEVQQ